MKNYINYLIALNFINKKNIFNFSKSYASFLKKIAISMFYINLSLKLFPKNVNVLTLYLFNHSQIKQKIYFFNEHDCFLVTPFYLHCNFQVS